MSDDDPKDLVPNVSEDRPLDSLMPEMRGGGEGTDERLHEDAPQQVGAIHPRVLEVGLEEGTEWSLASWEDPGPAGMRQQLGNLVEATLLKEMTRLPAWERDEERHVLGMRLLAFESLAEPSRKFIREIGFEEVPYEADKYTERMAAWRQEAQAADLDVPARPVSVWHLPIEHPAAARRRRLDGMASRILDQIGSEVWGQTPGEFSRFAATEIEETLGDEIGLGPEYFEVFADRLGVEATGAIRWMEPVFFQAICDYVGVLLHGHYGVQVRWGVCEADPRGIVPPPMFRKPGAGRGDNVPVGRHLLEWCMTPVAEGEPTPRLAERIESLAHQLTDET